MRHGIYSEAAKCYRNAGKPRETFFALTMALATDGSNSLNRSVAAIESTPDAEELIILQREKQNALITLHIAAERFRLLGMKSQAGQCYFSAKRYDHAAMMFQECTNYRACAECYVHLDFYARASFCYELCRDYEKAICCYDITADWSSALTCIQMFASIMPQAELESYVFHYFTRYCQSQAEESITSIPSESDSLEVDLSESALGLSIYKEIERCPAVLQCITSRAARKSPAVLSVLWTPSFDRIFSIEVLSMLELLEILCLPKLACLIAEEYRLQNVWQYCAAGCAHSLGGHNPIEAKQLLPDSKRCKKVQALASSTVGELETMLFSKSFLQRVRTDQTLERALLALGFLSTLRKLGGSGRLVSSSLGMCTPGDSSIRDLFASISARQATHPICTTHSAWDNSETLEVQYIFAANHRFWNYITITRDQNHESLVGLITYINSTLPSAVRQNDLVNVADCCSIIPLLLCWKEIPERWSNLSMPSFYFVMKMTKFLIKAALGHGTIRKKCSVSTWITAVDAALAPFQVYRLPSAELTGCLPVFTHYAISRHSLLFPLVVDTCANLPYYDITGEWFLVRLEVAANAFAVFVAKTLSSFLKERHSHVDNITERSDLGYLLLESSAWRSYRALALRAAKYANLYGEVAYIFSIQQLLPSAFPLVARRRTTAQAEIQKLYSKMMYLQGMVDEDEHDKKFTSFMKKKNKTEIKQLQKKLDSMRVDEFEDFCYRLVHYRREILFFFNWSVEEYPLTKCARKSLQRDASIDFASRPADASTVLECDRIFQVCESRSHFLWMVGAMFPDNLSLLYPLEKLQQGRIDEVAMWHLRVVDLLKDTTDELRNVLSHLSQGFLLGWLLSRPTVQCSYSLSQQLNTISCDEGGEPCENSSLHRSTMAESSQRIVDISNQIHYEKTRFSGFRDEQKGKECLNESLRLLRKCLKMWLNESGRLEGLLKHTVWKLIYFTISNAQLENVKLNEMIRNHVMTEDIAMKEYVDFVNSSNHTDLVNNFIILKKRKAIDKREIIVTILMFEGQCRASAPQRPKEDPKISALFQSLRSVPSYQYSLRKVLYASSLGLDGLLTDESVDCLSFQQFALELVLTLRQECANQRDAQVVLRMMAEVQAAWTDACSSPIGNRLNQIKFNIASTFLNQKKKEMEEWKKIPGQLPSWEDKRDLLPKKIL